MLACSYNMSTIPGPSDGILIKVNDNGVQNRYQPYEISGMILAYLKKLATERLGHAPRAAVISVPAYFNDSQREETKKAAAYAGLDVVRLVNEPTAAGVAFVFHTRPVGRRTLLVGRWKSMG